MDAFMCPRYDEKDAQLTKKHCDTVNGLNPGVSEVCIV